MGASMRGADITWLSSTIASDRPMLSVVDPTELHGALAVQREADGRRVELVERRTRVAKVAAGHRRYFPNQVVRRPHARRRATDDLEVGRDLAVDCLEQRGLIGRGARLDERQLQHRRLADDVLRAVDIGKPRKLDEDLVVRRPVRRHGGLGHAELVDPALDRLDRLRHGFGSPLHGDVRPHVERMRPSAGRLTSECERGQLVGKHPELLVHSPRNPFGQECFEPGDARRHRDTRVLGGHAQLLRGRLGLESNGIISLHFEHEVRAALEVETQRNFPARRSEGPNRQPGDNGYHEELPAKVLLHS